MKIPEVLRNFVNNGSCTADWKSYCGKTSRWIGWQLKYGKACTD